MNTVTVGAYIDIRRKARELGLAVPDAVWIAPSNFGSMASAGEAVYAADYDLVVKLFRRAGLPYFLLKSADESYPKLIQQSDEFVALPLLVFTKGVLEKFPEIVSQALDILLEYLRSKSGRDPRRDQPAVRLKIAKECGDSCVSAEYEGPIEGLKDVIEAVK